MPVVRLRFQMVKRSAWDQKNAVLLLRTVKNDPHETKFKLEKLRIFYSGMTPYDFCNESRQLYVRIHDNLGADSARGVGKDAQICSPDSFTGEMVDVWAEPISYRVEKRMADAHGNMHDVLKPGWKLKLLKIRSIYA